MGLDLKLLPFDSSVMSGGDLGDWAFSHTILNCERRSELFLKIREDTEEVCKPVPKNFSTFVSREDNEGTKYGNTQTDPYGEPIQSVPVKALLAFTKDKGVRNNREEPCYLGLSLKTQSRDPCGVILELAHVYQTMARTPTSTPTHHSEITACVGVAHE